MRINSVRVMMDNNANMEEGDAGMHKKRDDK